MTASHARPLRTSTCYVCGQPGSDTRDHLIPRSFFGGRLPPDTITLKAHAHCHDRDGEDYLRFFLVNAAQNSITADYLKRTKVARYAELNPRLIQEIGRAVQAAERDAAGQLLYIPDELAVRIREDLFWPTITRICRGIYFLLTGQIFPLDVEIRIVNNMTLPPHMQPERLSDVTRRAGLAYDGVFESWYYLDIDPQGATRWGWWLRFYGEVTFLCAARWPEQG